MIQMMVENKKLQQLSYASTYLENENQEHVSTMSLC